jgi:hypothetical protein
VLPLSILLRVNSVQPEVVTVTGREDPRQPITASSISPDTMLAGIVNEGAVLFAVDVCVASIAGNAID